MRLLHAPCGGGALAGSLGGQLLTRSLSSSGFTGGLLGTSHYDGVSPDRNTKNNQVSTQFIITVNHWIYAVDSNDPGLTITVQNV